MTAPTRNPKLDPHALLAALTKLPAAKSFGEERLHLELCGHYADDPDPETRRLYRAACEKWGARVELRRLEREWGRRERYPGPRLVGAGERFDAVAAARRGVEEARDEAAVDFATLLPMPWPRLHAAIGHGLLPYHFWTIPADSGQGKTTFVMSLVATWLSQGHRVFVLPMEQGEGVTRRYLAALAQGLEVKHVLKNHWAALPPGAEAKIAEHLAWQEGEGAKLLAMDPTGRPRVQQIKTLYARAADFGAEVVILDHIHRVAVRSYDEFAELCAMCKELAKHHRIPCIATAQNHRGQGPVDRLKAHLYPTVDRIQGGKVLEQESDEVLAVYRPLQDGLDDNTMKSLQRGLLPVGSYLKPRVVGVALLKARLEGNPGTLVELEWRAGKIVDPDEERDRELEDRYAI